MDISAIAIAIGALSGGFWAGPSSRLRWLLFFTFIALSFTSIGVFYERMIQTEESSYSALLLQTHFGTLWIVRIMALLLLWAGWKWNLKPSIPFILCCILAFTRSATGHGSDYGDGSLPEISDWLHFISGSALGGGLIALTVVLYKRKEFGEIASRFSTMAGYALGIVILTGLYNTWIEVGGLSALFNTPYGTMITLKIILLLILAILGASNRYIVIPHLPATHRRFRHNVMLEALLAVLIFISTAILIHEMPPIHILRHKHMQEVK